MRYHTSCKSTGQLVARPPGFSFSCFVSLRETFYPPSHWLVSLWNSVSLWIPWWKNVKCANLWPLHWSLWMLLRNMFYDETPLKLEIAQSREPSPLEFSKRSDTAVFSELFSIRKLTFPSTWQLFKDGWYRDMGTLHMPSTLWKEIYVFGFKELMNINERHRRK